MAKENKVEELYTVATDPGSGAKKLLWAWGQTKSSRVRKAIASNPNSDSKILAMAARLYIKEVINNPSLELINLFNEDKFVKEIYEAYMDPRKYTRTNSIYQFNEKKNIARSILVSPNLRTYEPLSSVISFINQTDFTRELKDPVVKENIQRVVKSNLDLINLPTAIFFMKCDVIDINDFESSLDQRMPESRSSNWVGRSTYCKFFSKLAENFCTYETLLKFIYTATPGNSRDFIKMVKEDSNLSSDEMLDLYASLYKHSIHIDVKLRRQRKVSSRMSYSYKYTRLRDDDWSYPLCDLLWTAIISRNSDEIKNFDFETLHGDLDRVGFIDEMGPYKCPIKFQYEGISNKNKAIDSLLNLKDNRVLEFFLTSGMVKDEWFISRKTSSLESKLVDRIDHINELKFYNGEPLLYEYSNLELPCPVVRVKFQNGLNSNHKRFKVYTNYRESDSDLLKLPLPEVSGRASSGLLDKISTP
jgi:hypothetical protein